MAISFIGAGTVVSVNNLAGTTGLALTPHASTLTDDLMIAFMHRNDNSGTFDSPAATGWTTLAAETTAAGADMQTLIAYKKATSDSEGEVTFTHSDTLTEQWAGVILTFRGQDTTTPIDTAYVSGSHYIALEDKATTNVDAFATINVTTNQACVIALEAVTHDDITSNADPTNYTVAVRNIGSAEDYRQFQVWYRLGLSTGDETPGAPAYTSSITGAESHQYTIAIRPDPGPPIASGNPSITGITSSGTAILAPKVWLNTTETLSGATQMTRTAFNTAGTSITFTDPSGAPTGSLKLGVESRNGGGGEVNTDWIAVTVSAVSAKTASGTPDIEVVTASGVAGSIEGLLADDVESASEVTAPVIAQENALLADDVESASEVTAPVIAQENTLLAAAVESTSEVTAPALSESHILLAADVESTSEVTAPVIAQENALLAADVESTSEVTAPVIAQENALLAADVESMSEVTAPVIAQENTLLAAAVESTSEVTAPALSESHILLAADVESTSEVTAPVIAQENALLAADVESTSEVTAPVIAQENALLAADVESMSEVTAPALSESHILLATAIESVSEVTAPILAETHVLLADDVESSSEVITPSVNQIHALIVTQIESASEVTAPVLIAGTALLAADVESASEVSAPTLTQVHAMLADDTESASEVNAPRLNYVRPYGKHMGVFLGGFLS